MVDNRSFTFQKILSKIFADLVNKILVVYLVDILIFSKTLDAHMDHLKIVLSRLFVLGFRINWRKCNFLKNKIIFLGFELENNKMRLGQAQRDKFKEISIPRNHKEVRSYLGSCTFVVRFIRDYTKLILPFQILLSKKHFEITEIEEKAFKNINEAIINSRELTIPDQSKQFYLFTDASNIIIAGVLCQVDDENNMCAITWICHKLKPCEINYAIREK